MTLILFELSVKRYEKCRGKWKCPLTHFLQQIERLVLESPYFLLQGKVIEPLRDFHKDEVRELGVQLGIPKDLVSRHPFPGPGLAIRVICGDLPYHKDDYGDTKLILTTIVNYSRALSTVSSLFYIRFLPKARLHLQFFASTFFFCRT